MFVAAAASDAAYASRASDARPPLDASSVTPPVEHSIQYSIRRGSLCRAAIRLVGLKVKSHLAIGTFIGGE